MKGKYMVRDGKSLCNDNNMLNSLASYFNVLPPQQFALLSSLIGIALVDGLDINQQNSLGNFIVNVGQAILTVAAQGQSLQSNDSQNNHVKKQIQTLKEQICALEGQLNS